MLNIFFSKKKEQGEPLTKKPIVVADIPKSVAELREEKRVREQRRKEEEEAQRKARAERFQPILEKFQEIEQTFKDSTVDGFGLKFETTIFDKYQIVTRDSQQEFLIEAWLSNADEETPYHLRTKLVGERRSYYENFATLDELVADVILTLVENED